MPIHPRAAISYGNDCLKTLPNSHPVDLGRPDRGGRHHAAFRPGEDRQDHAAQPAARSPSRGRAAAGQGGAARPNILCSEENSCLWALRQPPLDFGPQLEFHQPLRRHPSPDAGGASSTICSSSPSSISTCW